MRGLGLEDLSSLIILCSDRILEEAQMIIRAFIVFISQYRWPRLYR